MKLSRWYFVYDTDGDELAAFPERTLAEMYSENTNWIIRDRDIAMDDRPADLEARALKLSAHPSFGGTCAPNQVQTQL